MENRQHLTYRLGELLQTTSRPRPWPTTSSTTLANNLGHHPGPQPRPPPKPTTLATTLANILGHQPGQQPRPPPGQKPRPPPWPTTLATTLANHNGRHCGRHYAAPAGNRFSLHTNEEFFARPSRVSTYDERLQRLRRSSFFGPLAPLRSRGSPVETLRGCT